MQGLYNNLTPWRFILHFAKGEKRSFSILVEQTHGTIEYRLDKLYHGLTEQANFSLIYFIINKRNYPTPWRCSRDMQGLYNNLTPWRFILHFAKGEKRSFSIIVEQTLGARYNRVSIG
jgi:intergrase/recombinase